MTQHPPGSRSNLAHEKFAIAIPSKGQGRYVDTCLASIRSREEISVFVADAQSEDNTVECLRKAPSFVRWCSEPDRGQSDAINKAFRHLDGTIMCYMNLDDGYLEGALDKVAEAFKSSGADVVLGWAQNKRGDRLGEVWGPTPESLKDVGRYFTIFEPAAFWRPRVWQDLGPFRENLKYVFGWDFMCRAVHKYTVHVIQEPVAYNGLHGSRKTVTGDAARRAEILDLVARYAGEEGLAPYRRIETIPAWLRRLVFHTRPRRLGKIVYDTIWAQTETGMDYERAASLSGSLRGY